MENKKPSGELLSLLGEATAREMQVATQYMLQHSVYGGKRASVEHKLQGSTAQRFVASHSPVYLPGRTLKKIAVAEMRHAEAIAERVSVLGGEPTTQPKPLRIGKTLKEILEIDKAEEETAIALYNRIILAARQEGDDTTESLFRRVLRDEETHLRVFADLSTAMT